MNESPTSLVSLREARERAVALLSDCYAHDGLEVEEFEQRFDLVHRASTVAEIDKLLEGVPGSPAQGEPAERAIALRVASSEQVPERRNVVAVLSGTQRKGPWTMPRQRWKARRCSAASTISTGFPCRATPRPRCCASAASPCWAACTSSPACWERPSATRADASAPSDARSAASCAPPGGPARSPLTMTTSASPVQRRIDV